MLICGTTVIVSQSCDLKGAGGRLGPGRVMGQLASIENIASKGLMFCQKGGVYNFCHKGGTAGRALAARRNAESGFWWLEVWVLERD